MEKKVFLNYEGLLQFSNALELLNASINEFNKIADKMVPEKLLHDGLLSYLRYFCKSLEESSNVKFLIESKVTDLGAGEEAIINLFRVIRSILLMLLKNSQPGFISIFLFKSDNLVKIHIEDDGMNIFKQPLFMVSQTMESVGAILENYKGKLVTNTMPLIGNITEIEVQL